MAFLCFVVGHQWLQSFEAILALAYLTMVLSLARHNMSILARHQPPLTQASEPPATQTCQLCPAEEVIPEQLPPKGHFFASPFA